MNNMFDAKVLLTNKRFLLVLSLVVVMGVSVVWGLKIVADNDVSAPAEVETTYGPIKLTLRLNKTTYELGELVNITVTVTNISNETTVLGYTGPPELDFWVYNESSVVIYKYHQAYIWTCHGVDLVLAPGKSLNQTYYCPRWTWVWDQTHARIQVPRGTYYITGRTGPRLGYLGPLDQYDPKHLGPKIQIETPKIEIQII